MAAPALADGTLRGLVEAALDHIYETASCNDGDRCCPVCCTRCAALLAIDKVGYLSMLWYPARSELWVDELGRVDRAMLRAAWMPPCPGCHRAAA